MYNSKPGEESVDWEHDKPIHRQVRDKIATLIIEGAIKSGTALPSVRQAAVNWGINPLTVLKGYQHLVQENIVIKQRGKQFMVIDNAEHTLIAYERKQFIKHEWPTLVSKLKKLGLTHLVQES